MHVYIMQVFYHHISESTKSNNIAQKYSYMGHQLVQIQTLYCIHSTKSFDISFFFLFCQGSKLTSMLIGLNTSNLAIILGWM